MRRARSAGGFHTDAVFAVDNGRACEPQMKPDRAGAASRRDIPFFLAGRGHAPIFNPCQPPAIVEARFAECATATFLFETKCASVHVRDSEMGKREVVDNEP